MKAIRTKYYGPGNVKGSRIIATDDDGNRVVLGYDDSKNSTENHQAAAYALCAKMQWTGSLIGGQFGVYNYWVFTDSLSVIADEDRQDVAQLFHSSGRDDLLRKCSLGVFTRQS